MKRTLCVLPILAAALLLGTVLADASVPKARLIPPTLPCDDYAVANVVATDAPYSLPTDGSGDCTAGLQAAIDAVSRAGGGVVFLPAGRYLFAGTLRLSAGVTLRGEWRAPVAGVGAKGTILEPTGGKGQEDSAPFIAMQAGACVRNLTIWYPEQNGETPYPWTIANDSSKGGDCFTVENVTLANPYQAIGFQQGSELHVLRNIYGTPLKTGIFIDRCTDTGRLVGIHFGPDWWPACRLGTCPAAGTIADIMDRQATAIVMTRVDCDDLYDITLESFHVGILAARSESGDPYLEGYGIVVQGGEIGLSAEHASFGLQFSHCRFAGRLAGISAAQTFGTAIQLTNCDLAGSDAIVSDASGGTIQCQQCRFGGSVSLKRGGSLFVHSCILTHSDAEIKLAPAVIRALIDGGIPRSAVTNESLGDVQIGDSRAPAASTVGDIGTLPQLPPDPRPATAQLFDVTDYGALANGSASGGADNTAAFQKALDAAGAAGGGTVYAPAGIYRFAGSLTVPKGVELRGSFDCPHHTVSGGTLLFPTAGRGREDGTPFLRLEAGAGARGLTVWYPDQQADAVKPYPWTVRGGGPGCWLMDFSVGNSYMAYDFGSASSDGDLLRDDFGCALKRGMWVSKGDRVVVDGCHFNPHFWLRTYPGGKVALASPTNNPEAAMSDYINANLEAYAFGDCSHLLAVDDAQCTCWRGFRFGADQSRGSDGLVINLASDCTKEGALRVDAIGPGGLRMDGFELITLFGTPAASPLTVSPSANGRLFLCSGMSYGETPGPPMTILGRGETDIDGWKALTTHPIHVGNGTVRFENLDIYTAEFPQIQLESPVAGVTAVCCAAAIDAFIVPKAPRVTARLAAKALAPVPMNDVFVTDFGQGAPKPEFERAVYRLMSSSDCRIVPGVGRDSGSGLVLSSRAEVGAPSSAAYYVVYDVDIPVTPDMYLRYWVLPSNEASSHIGIDMLFDEGAALRDRGVTDLLGRNLHPAQTKGPVGHWNMIQASLSAVAGRRIKRILFAYEGKPDSPSDIQAIVDKIEIGEIAKR